MQTNTNALRAEQAVLGGLLLSKDSEHLENTRNILPDNKHFSGNHHRIIFEAIVNICEHEELCDSNLLIAHLEKYSSLKEVGGEEYIYTLTEYASPHTVIAMARQVRSAYDRSRLSDLLIKTQKTTQTPKDKDPSDIITTLEAELTNITSGYDKKPSLQNTVSIVDDTIEYIDKHFKSKDSITGVDTGFKSINLRTSGWQPSDMIILAARPSMGKTALALNFVEHALKNRPDQPVVIFSLEMPARSLIMRLMSSKTGIPLKDIMHGKFKQSSWKKINMAAEEIKKCNLIIDDTPGLTVEQMQFILRRIKKNIGDPQLVMIDYLQLMQAPNKENRVQEITYISQKIKQAARTYECPIIALSQLSRAVDSRPNKHPVMSDLRDSGAIEQDADLIMFLYREEQYNRDTENKGVADLELAKHRNGATGTVELFFRAENTSFTDLDKFSTQNHAY